MIHTPRPTTIRLAVFDEDHSDWPRIVNRYLQEKNTHLALSLGKGFTASSFTNQADLLQAAGDRFENFDLFLVSVSPHEQAFPESLLRTLISLQQACKLVFIANFVTDRLRDLASKTGLNTPICKPVIYNHFEQLFTRMYAVHMVNVS